MPARVVVVCKDPRFCGEVTKALRGAGYIVAVFQDSHAALESLDAASRAEILITDVEFDPGRPRGLSLSRMALTRCPDLKSIFIGRPEHAEHVSDHGIFLEQPTTVRKLMSTVEGLLTR